MIQRAFIPVSIIFSLYGSVAGAAAPIPVSSLFDDSSNLATNAQTQWLLARHGCDVGSVDGIIHLSRKKSKTEKCLDNFGVDASRSSPRILNELNQRLAKEPLVQINSEVVQRALQGIVAGKSSRKLSPSLEQRSKAAREGLGALTFSESLPFVLHGMSQSNEEIRDYCRSYIERENFREIPEDVWQFVMLSGSVTEGVRFFLRGLNARDQLQNTQALISMSAERESTLNGSELLGEMIRLLWEKPQGGKKEELNSQSLVPLVDLLLEHTDKQSEKRLTKNDLNLVLRGFGNDILKPLLQVYVELGDVGAKSQLIRDFLESLRQPALTLKHIVNAMNGTVDDYLLGRLIHDISKEYIN